jgi:hypothetical protein
MVRPHYQIEGGDCPLCGKAMMPGVYPLHELETTPWLSNRMKIGIAQCVHYECLPTGGNQMAKRSKKKAKAKHYPRMDVYREAIADLKAGLKAMGKVVLGLQQRVASVEEFLGDDLKTFHEKQPEPSDEQRVQQADG